MNRLNGWKLVLPVLLILLVVATERLAAEDQGIAVYKKHCVSCHGANGEGVKDEFDEPLTGKRSLSSLISYIDRKMPEGDKKAVVGADAKAVATYIYDAFYSPVAQARIKPPRVRLSRLTVNQYRNATADLVSLFDKPIDRGSQKGLEAKYFHSGRFDFDSRPKFKRIEPGVNIDFGDKKPHKSLDGKRFGILWSGSVFVEETGDYEFVLDSPNGVKLWVNDLNSPIIDARVRSGNFDPIRASAFLLGGRAYPIRVALFKYEKDKRSGIVMKWKRPHRVDELLPVDVLSPVDVKPVMVVKAAFPPDDRSMGYVHGAAVSKQWDEATTFGALECADFVASRSFRFTSVRAADADAARVFPPFAEWFAERAFSRPLTKEQKHFFVRRHFEGAKDNELALKKSLLLTLKSPRFLYPEISAAKVDDYAVASRLALAMWDSIPDRALLETAKRRQLHTREQIVKAIDRMMDDPRTRMKMRSFFRDWLNVERLHNLSKNRERFPEFDESIVSDLRDSLDLFVENVLWSERSDFRKLMQSDAVYLNDRLAKFYGAKVSKEGEFEKVSFERRQYAGVLSHPLLMAGFAYDSTSSPIHRGVFVARSLLGRRLVPPPIAVTPDSPDLHPDMTTRDRVSLQTKSETCMSCHSMINPLGFTLENYDAVGRYRLKDGGKPVDATGFYRSLEGKSVKFKGADELGRFLANSEEAHAAFVQRLFLFTIKQPMLAYGLDTPENLLQSFKRNDYNIRKLLVEVVATAAMHGLSQKNASSK